MPSTKCPACGKQADGRFCSWCGAALGGIRCPSCGAPGEPGGRFCNACGTPLGGASGPRKGAGAGSAPGAPGSRIVWGVAGVLMVAVILAVILPLLRRGGEQQAAPPGMGAAPATGSGVPDISDMTPREAADQLYERIMRTSSAGDSAGAAFFLPMGIKAYDRARPLDADGLFHLSLLQRMAGDPEGALATAEEALAAHPGHLLNLAAAGAAAADAGDRAAAEDYYRTFLESYDDEMARGRPEYEAHSGMMPELRQEAVAFTEGGGGG